MNSLRAAALRLAPPLLAVSLLLLTPPVRADDTNYQNYVVGQRTMGMGGAYTALATLLGQHIAKNILSI